MGDAGEVHRGLLLEELKPGRGHGRGCWREPMPESAFLRSARCALRASKDAGQLSWAEPEPIWEHSFMGGNCTAQAQQLWQLHCTGTASVATALHRRAQSAWHGGGVIPAAGDLHSISVYISFFFPPCFSLLMSSDKAVRRPDLIKPWRPPPPTAPDDLPPDYMALLSLMFGLVGLLGKVPPRRAFQRPRRVLHRAGRAPHSHVCVRADEAGFVAGDFRVHFLPSKRQKVDGRLQADAVQRHVSAARLSSLPPCPPLSRVPRAVWGAVSHVASSDTPGAPCNRALTLSSGDGRRLCAVGVMIDRK